MLKKLLNPPVKDICPNCGQACEITDVLCPKCGKNLDELFEQLPDLQVPLFSFVKFIKKLFVILIGILIPIATARLAVAIPLTYGSIYDSGSFIQWHSLGSPPEKVTKILGFCDYAVCVQMDSQKIYRVSASNCNESPQPCWEQLEQPVIEEPPFESCWFKFADKNPPQHVIQIIKTNECSTGGAIQANHALLVDGNIWVWEHTVTDLQGSPWSLLAIPVAILSFIVGVVVSLIYTPIIWKKMGNDDAINNSQNSVTSTGVYVPPSKKILFAAIYVLLIGAVFCATSYVKNTKAYLDPYSQFRKMEIQALPQFDRLNEKTYQELPEPPSSFKFPEKTSYGIDSRWHMGRWMTISYIGPKESEDEFFEYYGTYLLNKNWMLLEEKNDGQIQEVLYYKETSCIRLSTSAARPGVYFIGIWQDFESQPFISIAPSHDVLGSYLSDSWIIAKCP